MTVLTDRQRAAERVAEWEERAAIIEYDGRFHRDDAEPMACRQLGRESRLGKGNVLNMIDSCGPGAA